MKHAWQKLRLSDFIDINPIERLSKGTLAKKISMECLEPYCRDIESFAISEFQGGSKFRNGDTLMARITPCLENGKTAQVNILGENEIGFGSTEFIILREKKGISDKNYIYYLSRSSLIRDSAIKSMIGSSGRQRVQLDVLKNLEILVPPLEEQIRYGGFLKKIDDKIEVNRKINHHLQQIAQAFFYSWFIDFEPFGGKVPANWNKGNLLDIADYLNGLPMQRFRPSNNEIGIPVLKIKELRQGFCDASSDLCSPAINPDYIIRNGDVIFSWSGSLLVDFWCGNTCGLNQHLFKVTSKKFDKWFYYLWTQHYLKQFISLASDKATTMGHIKRGDLINATVLIPNNEDYFKAAKLLQPICDQIISNRLEGHQLALLRDILIPELISGTSNLLKDHNLEK